MNARKDSTQMLSRLLVELKDPESALAENMSSTYSLQVPTEDGLLQMLFRLVSGDPNRPDIVSFYLGGKLIEGLDHVAAAAVVTAACEAAPWHLWDE